MKKLLIAYDGTPGSETALNDLAHAGLPVGLEVLVLSVADVWLPGDSEGSEPALPVELPEAVLKARAEAKQALENSRELARQAAERLQRQYPAWKVESAATADSPAWAVVKHAASWNSDLVVLGSHSRSILERLFLGSTAQKVAAEAQCSVRIVRPRRASDGGPLRILLALDGSALTLSILDWVRTRPWPENTQFRAMMVIDPHLESAVAGPSSFAQQWIRAGDRGPEDWVRRILDHARERWIDRNRTLETEVVRGEPKQLLLREADHWQADSLFMGSRGLHHRERLFLGSTVSAVAARAQCTVEIVRVPHAPESGGS